MNTPPSPHDLESALRRPLPETAPSPHVRTRVMAHIRSEAPARVPGFPALIRVCALVALLGVASWVWLKPRPVYENNVASALALPSRSTELAFNSLPRLEEKARSTYETEWLRMRADLEQLEGFVIERLPNFAAR